MTRLLRVALVSVSVSVSAVAYASTPALPIGEWSVADGNAKIRIQPCGANLCGTVAWAKESGHIGMQILRSMKPAGQNRWEGTILDPRNGKIYQSNITLSGSNLLRVQGCIMGVLCGGETWKRAS